MLFNQKNPLIVQRNGTVVVETKHEKFPIIQPILSQIATLELATDCTQTYKISGYSIWSSYIQGIQLTDIINFLHEYCKYPISDHVVQYIEHLFHRSLAISMELNNGLNVIVFHDQESERLFLSSGRIRKLITRVGEEWVFDSKDRGTLKAFASKYGYFIDDRIGYDKGQKLNCSLQRHISLRPYQREAVEKFWNKGNQIRGNGIIVMPCGSGKTVVGLGVIEKVKEEVLIITSNETSMKQWQREILDKTTVPQQSIGLYTSMNKEVKPITIVSYQMMIYRDHETKQFIHLPLFNERKWGLIIYDEVHLLPAPIFRSTAAIQGKRRLGLTATLVREDGKEEEVYSLIGPKQYEVAWKGLENNGWIAKMYCKEIRIDLSENDIDQYVNSNGALQFKIAATNCSKLQVIDSLLKEHSNQPTLIIGQYLDQLRTVADSFQLPMITGKTPQKERDTLYEKFRQGEICTLIVSKVANYAVDLPDAQVAIQISGAFGSRQEEAQRVGRLLRPKQNEQPGYFYTIVTKNSKEEQYSEHRQMFMLEQGYEYEVEEWLS